VQTAGSAEIVVHYGSLKLQGLHLSALEERSANGVSKAGENVGFKQYGAEIVLSEPVQIRAGERIAVKL